MHSLASRINLKESKIIDHLSLELSRDFINQFCKLFNKAFYNNHANFLLSNRAKSRGLIERSRDAAVSLPSIRYFGGLRNKTLDYSLDLTFGLNNKYVWYNY